MAGDSTQRVLVVDDDPVSRMMLAHIVRNDGYEVAEADSVAAALSELADAPADLVISDYMMPGGSGLDLLDVLPDPTVPFVLLTGVLEADSLGDARIDALAAYLTKPFASDDVRELVSRLAPQPS